MKTLHPFLFIIVLLSIALTSCKDEPFTVTLGQEVDGELALAEGVELADQFEGGYTLAGYSLHTNKPDRWFLRRVLTLEKSAKTQYIELDRTEDGTLTYTFNDTRSQGGDDADDNDIDAMPGKDCTGLVCPVNGGQCRVGPNDGPCECGQGQGTRPCVRRTDLHEQHELIK